MRVAAIAATALGLVACQTPAAGKDPRPATLERVTPESREALTRALEAILKQGRVRLGPGDLGKESVITVLPPPPGPYEGNSPAMPAYFELMTDGKTCFALERRSSVMHPLPGVACRAK